MRSIVNINVCKEQYEIGYCNEAKCGNSILFEIIVGEMINPYLEITLQDGSIVNTDVLEINEKIIKYEMPLNYVYTKGTLKVRVMSDERNSEYIEFTILSTLISSDDIVFIEEEEQFFIKKIARNNSSEKVAVELSGVNSSSSYECFYFPRTGMVWFAMYVTGRTYPASTRNVVATIPERYRPERRTALAIDGLQGYSEILKASISIEGEIGFTTSVAKDSGNDQYISGWWYVPTE